MLPWARRQSLPFRSPRAHRHPEVLEGPLDLGGADEGEIILHEVVQPRQLVLDLGERLGHLGGTLRGGIAQFFLQQIRMQKNGPQGVADFMRHPGCQPAEQGKVLEALGLLRQALAFRHFLLEGGRAVRHALLELCRRLRERGFGSLAGGQFGLHLLIEVGILEGHGRVGGQPHQDGFVPVGEGTARGVRGVEQPLHPRRHPDRHGENSEAPLGSCPRQIVFAKARIGGIVRRAPRPPGAQHLPPSPWPGAMRKPV